MNMKSINRERSDIAIISFMKSQLIKRIAKSIQVWEEQKREKRNVTCFWFDKNSSSDQLNYLEQSSLIYMVRTKV